MDEHVRLSSVVERLAQREGISKSAVGDRLGYKSGHWFMILSGKRTVTDRLLISMKYVYGLNIDYIKKGASPMLIDDFANGLGGRNSELIEKIGIGLKKLTKEDLTEISEVVQSKLVKRGK